MNAMGQRQRGIVAVMVAIALLALLAMVGLALDSGHVILNKSRLQNTVDASALAAAKVLDKTGSETQATTAARSVFDLNATNQPELSQVMSGADITVQYSNTLSPFAPGSAPANYVRVFANNFDMWTSFTSLVGVDKTSTAATAVAGPSAPITEPCDLAPMTVCANKAAGGPDWGYSRNNVSILKLASEADGSTIGPGNFQLIQLGGPGDNIVRQNLAGGYQGCVDANTVETQPGAGAGPVSQGLNTRFNKYQGGMKATDYPPDKIITGPNPELDQLDGKVVLKGSGKKGSGSVLVTDISQLNYSYSNYESDYQAGRFTTPAGKDRRRELAVPFTDCSNTKPGQTSLPVLGFGCFFLLQPVLQSGIDGYVFAQLIGECGAAGAPGPVGGEGLYKIVLHNDPASPDS